MTYMEMRDIILFRHHKDITYWWRLLGEMFEKTEGWTKPSRLKVCLNDRIYYVCWNNIWRLEEL